ncbi:MAG: lysophospholipase, partial [Pseudomonadota bacterium]|nr:lysophospholipase [Pseudomonadota bacterium]
MSRSPLRDVWLLALLALLAGCYPAGDAGVPIPHVLVPAPAKATRLVVVLPGRADDLAAMQRSGMAEAVQSAWPDADVILTALSLDYYMQGRAPQRLHQEIVAPARKHGYREVWLAGASMGGMGTLLYDQAYPGEMDGLVLLAPYLGEQPLLKEIADSGGITQWQAGPPAAITADNFQHELWRHVQDWSREPVKARNVWLAYGDDD